MTNGQFVQLQELGRCRCLPRSDYNFVQAWQFYVTEADHMQKREKAILRRLWHQYRHQIKAMKRNRANA